MERLINLGKFRISPYEVKNLKEYEVDEELWNIGWKLGVKDLMVFDEKDMFRINDEKYVAIYIDPYDKSLNFFHIPTVRDLDSTPFNYLFVKDI